MHYRLTCYFLYFTLFLITLSCSRTSENKEQKTGNDQHTAPPAVQPYEKKKTATEPTKNINIAEINPDTVKGQWLRPDGNYLLEIKAIGDRDQLDAAYYNPSPINIATAQIKKEEVIRIFIEFDDINYKGSHYNLEYDPANDVLRGTYYQATYGQTYPVAFIRYEE